MFTIKNKQNSAPKFEKELLDIKIKVKIPHKKREGSLLLYKMPLIVDEEKN